jgi:hypothetical protein
MEEMEVAGRHVGTLGGVAQALPTEGGNMVDRCCCRVGSRIIQHTRTPVSELLAPSPHHLHRHDVRTIHLHKRLWMLRGHTLFCYPVFNTEPCRRDEGRSSHNNRGMLPVDTEHSDIPPVLRIPRNKIEKLRETYFPTILCIKLFLYLAN